MTTSEFLKKHNLIVQKRFLIKDKLHKKFIWAKHYNNICTKIYENFKDETIFEECDDTHDKKVLRANNFAYNNKHIKVYDLQMPTSTNSIDERELYFWETGNEEYGWYEGFC